MGIKENLILIVLLGAASISCSYGLVWVYSNWQPKLQSWLTENTEQSLAEFLIYMPASLFWTRLGIILTPIAVLIFSILSIGYAIAFVVLSLLGTLVAKKILLARRFTKINEQLPNAIDLLVTAMSAGMSFHAAMDQTATKLPRPIRLEWLQIVRRERTGDGIHSALKTFY